MSVSASIKDLVKKSKSLTTNKIVKYVVMALALTNVIGYIAQGDYYTASIFVVTALVVMHFGNNLVGALVAALLVSSFLATGKTVFEGMTNSGKKSKKAEKEGMEGGEEEEPEGMEGDEDEEELEGMEGGEEEEKCPEGQELDTNGKCVSTFAMRPASVDGSSKKEDRIVGKRIDYASTLEQAYDNLQNMLGQDGIKNLTTDTKKLISQQKNLMGTLENMKPLLSSAKETLNGLNMGDLEKTMATLKNMGGLVEGAKGKRGEEKTVA